MTASAPFNTPRREKRREMISPIVGLALSLRGSPIGVLKLNGAKCGVGWIDSVVHRCLLKNLKKWLMFLEPF